MVGELGIWKRGQMGEVATTFPWTESHVCLHNSGDSIQGKHSTQELRTLLRYGMRHKQGNF